MPNNNEKRVFIAGVGMSKFLKPGNKDYPEMSLEATTKALLDAGVNYDYVESAYVGYVYGDSTCGQRALYQLGLTQIPIINVNNNCSTGSTALYLARQAVASGSVSCALALGFEKMQSGSLTAMFTDRTQPLDKSVELMSELVGISPVPINPQIFANGGNEYLQNYPQGNNKDHMLQIGEKNHKHSTLNPYAQFQRSFSFEQVKGAREIYPPLTLLQCSPTSDGAACAIVCSEDFIIKHNLQSQAVEIVAQVMATDSPRAFGVSGAPKSSLEICGVDMTRKAAKAAYQKAGITAKDVGVVELHDCFSANEFISYDALGLCEIGKAGEWLDSGAPWHPKFHSSLVGKKNPTKRTVVNPSGGLISKGHPLGATGLAQCCELTWQLRGWAGERQLEELTYGLQHNIGLGGAVVVGIYKKYTSSTSDATTDGRSRLGYNPAVEARGVSEKDVLKVISRKGTLVANSSDGIFDEEVKARL